MSSDECCERGRRFLAFGRWGRKSGTENVNNDGDHWAEPPGVAIGGEFPARLVGEGCCTVIKLSNRIAGADVRPYGRVVYDGLCWFGNTGTGLAKAQRRLPPNRIGFWPERGATNLGPGHGSHAGAPEAAWMGQRNHAAGSFAFVINPFGRRRVRINVKVAVHRETRRPPFVGDHR